MNLWALSLGKKPGRFCLMSEVCSLMWGPWYHCLCLQAAVPSNAASPTGRPLVSTLQCGSIQRREMFFFFRSGGHCVELQRRETPAAYSYKPQAWKQILVCLHSVWTQKPAQDISALIPVFRLTSGVTLGCEFSLELGCHGDFDLPVSNIFELQMWF